MDGKQLKNSILQWAIQGKLVPQNPKDEPASKLLERIAAIRHSEQSEESSKRSKKTSKTPTSRIYRENGVWYEQVGNAAPKDISDDIPFEIPENWAWCRLKDYLDVRDGTHDSPKYYSTGIPFVTSKNLVNGKIDFSDVKYISQEDHNLFSTRSKVDDNDILFAMIGSIGNPVLVKKTCDFSIKNVALFKPYNEETNMHYMLLYFQFIQNGLKKIAAGGVQSFISLNVFRNWLFPLPPLAEQKRIVAKLEQVLPLADEYGAAQEQLDKLNKELPEALKKSILQQAIQGKLVPQNPKDESAQKLLEKIRKEKEVLVKQGKLKKKDLECNPILEEEIPFEVPSGWVWARFEDLSLDSADGPFGSNLKKEHYTDKKEVRIIQLSNIGENGWKDTNTKYTTFEHLKNISRSEAFPGDIIVAKMMPAGRAIICPDEDKKYVLSSDAVRFDFSENLYKKYIYWAINSSVVKDQVYSEVQGITRVRTSLSKLRTYLIPIPPLAEQKRIVTKLEQLFKVL